MPTITIRDVPAETHAELAARAALSGRSLQEHLRFLLIELASQPDVRVLVERMRARKASTGNGLDAAQIMGYLDEERL